MALAAIWLTTPLMLLGLGFLALPIIAHLLHRRARHRIVFPSIELLSKSSASQSSLFRLRRLLVLIARCLAVAFIVICFARPLWHESLGGGAAPGDGAGVVIVLDVSASCSQRSGGVSAFESMRASATRALDSMASGSDVANVVFASARPTAAFNQMTPNLELVRREIADVRPGFERADIPGALALAGRILARLGGDPSMHRIVVVSDLQRSNWSDVDVRLKRARAIPAGTRIEVVPPGEPTRGNVALSEPSHLPRRVLAGQPASTSVRVSNFGDASASATIALEIDGEAAGEQRIELAPWQRSEVSFTVRFDAPGHRRLRFSIRGGDALDADNTAWLALEVSRRLPVLVAGDDDPEEPGSCSYFVSRALAPRGDVEGSYDVRVTPSIALTEALVLDAGAVVVSRVNELDERAAGALTAGMRAGAGVAILCGGGPVEHNTRILDAAAGEPILPWSLLEARELRGTEPLVLGSGDWRSSTLAEFDTRSQSALARIPFDRVWRAGERREGARTLLSFDDGTPALGSREVGLGKVVLAGFSPELEWSDLGKYGSFVALMHAIVRDLRPRAPGRGAVKVGEPLTLLVERESAAGLRLLGPDGETVFGASVVETAAGQSVTATRVRAPGLYAVAAAGETLAIAAANVDARESDLGRLDAAAVRSMLEAGGAAVNISALTRDDVELGLHGRPLWGWLLVLAFFAFGAELAMVATWRR